MGGDGERGREAEELAPQTQKLNSAYGRKKNIHYMDAADSSNHIHNLKSC
jgi:hypothetical protein